MSFLELPIRSDALSYTFSCDLDGQSYGFQFNWNDRAEFWAMSVFTEAGDPIVEGVPVRLGADLLGRFADERLPPGTFFLWDTTDKNQEAGRDDFGDRVLLVYNEEETS